MTPAVAAHAELAQRTRHRVTRRLIPFLFLLYVISYIDRINVGFAALQMTSDLHFTDAVFGFGSGIFFIGYFILGIPGAMLVEKWSARRTIAATLIAWGFIASSIGLIHTAHQFYTLRFVLGLAEAGFFPGVITYLNFWYCAQDRAKAVALFMTAVPISQVLASPLAAWLMRVHWMGLGGWRWLLILEGAPAVVGGLISWFYLTDRPRDAHWLKREEREWLIDDLAREHSRKTAATGKVSFFQAIRHRDVLLLAIAYFGGTVGSYGLGIWLPKILQRVGHLTIAKTALISGIPALIAVPIMILNGWNSDRTGERILHTAMPRILGAVALALTATMLSYMSIPMALFLFAVATAGVVAAYPPLWAIPGSFLGGSAVAASIGMIGSIGNTGGFAGPYLIGALSTKTGSYAAGLWGVAAFMLMSGVLVLFVRKPKRVV